MLSMQIEYGEAVIRIFPRAFAPWEAESDYGRFISDDCRIIVTVTDADSDEIVGGGNDVRGIEYDIDILGKHYIPIMSFIDVAINSADPEMSILSWCKGRLVNNDHMFTSVSFIN